MTPQVALLLLHTSPGDTRMLDYEQQSKIFSCWLRTQRIWKRNRDHVAGSPENHNGARRVLSQRPRYIHTPLRIKKRAIKNVPSTLTLSRFRADPSPMFGYDIHFVDRSRCTDVIFAWSGGCGCFPRRENNQISYISPYTTLCTTAPPHG
jgi:hypothetical protein